MTIFQFLKFLSESYPDSENKIGNEARMNAKPTDIYKTVVLIVNDQKMICEVVRRMLSSEEDIICHFCLDASKAMETAIETAPTVILQDLIMPDVDGLTLLKEYRLNPKTKHIPIIVLSSEEDPLAKAAAFALDANDYLSKIPDKVELLARLRLHSRGYINRIEKEKANIKLQKYNETLISDLTLCQNIIENSNIGFLVLSKNGDSFTITNLNNHMEKILQKVKADVLDRNISEILPTSIAPQILDAIKQVDLTGSTEVLKKLNSNEWEEIHISKYQSGRILIIINL